jgi:threonine synthase
MLFERYGAFLPLTGQTPRLSLGEGDTPLIAAPAWRAPSACVSCT